MYVLEGGGGCGKKDGTDGGASRARGEDGGEDQSVFLRRRQRPGLERVCSTNKLAQFEEKFSDAGPLESAVLRTR